MINLIPPQGKTLVKNEYIVRVVAVGCLSVAVALIISTIALLPAYVLFSSAYAVTPLAGTEDAHTERATAEVERSLNEATAFAEQLQKTTGSLATLDILTHIESAVSPAIVLENFIFSEEGGAVIRARGTATTRESLRKFIETLKRDAFFADASVPVSDLARDTEVVFTVTLTLRTET